MSKRLDDNVNNFIKLMTQITYRLLKADSDGKLIGFASGFFYQPQSGDNLFFITAGHEMPENGCFIETNMIKEGKPLCINAGDFKIFYNDKNIDYAYSQISIESIKESLRGIAKIELLTYQNAFIKAEKKDVYGFAVLNNHEFIINGNDLMLPRYCCFEFGLRLVRQEEHINFFETARPIQDHDYYRGASGSPVATPLGQITGILVGGTDPIEYLKVFRLDNIILNTDRNNGC